MVLVFSVDNPIDPWNPDFDQFEKKTAQFDAASSLDSVLLGYSSIWPHNHAFAPHMFARTSRVSFIVAHRPGVMDPAAAARYFATLDRLANGRLAINIVVGNADKDINREGDYLPKEQRYERAIEYVEVMKEAWASDAKFTHDGKYFTEANVQHALRPRDGHIPIFMGGQSAEAVEFGARHADTYMLWGEPLAGTKERIDTIRHAAARHGRSPDFSMNIRVFLGETDDEAWAQAQEAEQAIVAAQGTTQFLRSGATDATVGKKRVLDLADEVYDDCFWTRLIQLLGGFGTAASLVGTPDRVLATLAQYRDLGVGAFLLTTGKDGVWDPALDQFAKRVKTEL